MYSLNNIGSSFDSYFGIWLEVLPVAGWGDLAGDKILPTITLGTVCSLLRKINSRWHVRNFESRLYKSG